MTTPEHEPVRHRGLITMCVIFGTTIQALDSTTIAPTMPVEAVPAGYGHWR